jgi:hypothetical protein
LFADKNMIAMDELVSLIGQSIHGRAARLVLGALDHTEEIEEDELEEGTEPIHWLSYSENGFLIRHNPRGRIEVIHIYLVAEEDHAQFAGSLTKGIRPNDGRQEIRAKFGTPSRAGEPSNHKALGPQGAWDRFDCGDVSVHFLYHYDGPGIRRVTLIAPDVAP